MRRLGANAGVLAFALQLECDTGIPVSTDAGIPASVLCLREAGIPASSYGNSNQISEFRYLQMQACLHLVAARALMFTILTACRTGETLGARWQKIDFDARVWTVPAERMKSGRAHRVPLSEAAMAILKAASSDPAGGAEAPCDASSFEGNPPIGGLVFSNRSIETFAEAQSCAFVFARPNGKPLPDMAMVLRRMGVEASVHGFRSSFRDYCGEETSFAREISEAALAHATGDKVEAAYRRGDALEKRCALMTAWAAFLAA